VTRRTVRVDPQFFTELDAQLGESRGPNGEPSASDFLLIELPTIAEAFAACFDELLSVYPERDDFRYLVAGGLLVYAVAVQRGDITNEVALQRHEGYTEIKMRLLGDRVLRRTAWELAREHGWDSTFDAEYLAVCKLQADALVTIAGQSRTLRKQLAWQPRARV